MSKTTTALLGTILAAAGFALGHWTATRAPQPAPATGAPAGPEAARHAIAERVAAPASLENLQQLGTLLTQLGDDAIPAIPRTILHPGESLDAPRALVLLQFWIDRDPKAAVAWIARAAPLGYRSLAMIPAIERIAETEPGAAIKYVGRAGAADGHLVKPFVRGWVRSGQPGVEDWIRNLDYGFKRQKALGAFWRAKIETDGTAEAIAWFEALPESEDGFSEEAFQRLTSELTYADPAAAVAWYEKHRDGPRSKGLMMSLVDAWVAVDGSAAMRWVSQQPSGEERDNAVLDGIRWWGVADYQGLLRWARELGTEKVEAWLQPGLPILAKNVGNDDPREGIRWAEQIADEPTRLLTLSQIAREWYASDPAAAEAWLSQSPLPEEDRARARTPKAAANLPRLPRPAPVN